MSPRILRRAVLFALYGPLAFFSGCTRPPACYELRVVTVTSVAAVDDAHLELVYSTQAETMFASPGVDVDRSGDAIDVCVLRCFYEDDGKPDVRASAAEPYA